MTKKRSSYPSTRWLKSGVTLIAVGIAVLLVGPLAAPHPSTVVINSLAAAGGGLSLAGFIVGVVGVRKSKAENRAVMASVEAQLKAPREAKRR